MNITVLHKTMTALPLIAMLLICSIFSGNAEAQLQGSAGNVRVNIAWYEDVDLDLYVTDPCGQVFGYRAYSQKDCRGFPGEWDHDDTGDNVATDDPNEENIVWTDGAAAGGYLIHVNYFRGEIDADYTVSVFYGNQLETYTGRIGPETDGRQYVADFIADETVNFPVVSFASASSSVGEDAGTRNVTINLSSTPLSDITLNYTVSGSATEGSDYSIGNSGAIAVSDVAHVNIPITIVDDDVDENSETVVLSLNEGSGYSLGSPGEHSLTVTDNDETSMQVALSVSPDSVAEDAGATVVTVTGTLDAAPRDIDTVVTVSVGASSDSATEGTDYGTVDAFELTIDAFATSGTATFTLTPEGDGVDEDDETLSVTGTTSAQLSVTGTTATIVDDDTHVVELSVSALSVPEDGSSTYTVVLTGAPGHDVTVTPRSDNADVKVSPARLRFDSNNPWDVPQAVTVSAVRDDDTADDVATITHEVSGLDETDGGSVTVTVEPGIAEEQEKAALTDTLATVTSAAVSNVTTNIGTRFSAARAGTSLSLAGRTITLGDAYERTFVDQYGESFQNGEYDARDLDLDDVLQSAGFQIALGAADGTGAHTAAQWTLWGRGDLQFFSSDPSRGAGYDGQLQAGYFGVDVQFDGGWLAGVAVSRTSAEADYSVEASSAGNDGRMDIRLNSVLPYVRFAPDEKTDLWAILGAGRGQIENRRPDSQSLAENSDVTLLMAAAGARRALATDGPLGWALLGDFNAGRVETDGGTQAIAGLTVDVRRIRLGVEGSYTLEVEDGVTLTSFMEMSGRHDGGDGEDMYGLELSPGLYLSNPESRIGLEVRGRVLALNSADEYKEYGVSATVSVLPRTDGLGLSLSLSPTWGSAGSASASEFQRDDDFLGSVSAPHERAGMSLDSRLGYGIAVASGRLTPFGEFSLTDVDRRSARIGIRFGRRNSGLGDLSLEFVGERGESLDGESDRRLSAAGRLRF